MRNDSTDLREETVAPPDDSQSSKPTTSQHFVDLSTLGLRRGKRKRVSPRRLTYGLLVMAVSFLSSTDYLPIKAYHGFLAGYDDYLDTSFDGTSNSMNIMGQIYLNGKMNNEINTSKEMIQQPDKREFEKVMQAEIKTMFDNQFWTKLSRQ